jgi:predicted nucleotidyltransferase
MTINGIDFPEEAITGFCRRHGVKKLSVFGSLLRQRSAEDGYGFRPSSDLDILVEFLPDRIPGLLYFGGMLMELQEMLGRNVDLKTPQDLSRDFRDEVIREARPLYAA